MSVDTFGEVEMRKALLAGLLMVGALSTASAAVAEIGRIKSVAGTASVMRGKSVTPATLGYQLLVSDVLQTGANGRIGITFADNSRFSIGPNTRISLTQFEFNDTTHKGRSLTTVDRGALGIVSGQIAKENRDGMKVRTPTSLLAARGTTFVVEVP
jgi:hypothetical protein